MASTKYHFRRHQSAGTMLEIMFYLALSLSSGVKVNVMNRVIAKIIDLTLVVSASALLPYPLGPIIGFLYSLFSDGLTHPRWKGQSVGKKIMKLKVRHLLHDRPVSLKDSALRNSPVAVATFFAIIPVWGWLILILVGLPLMIMEVYLMVSVESGHRLGDVMGDTEVISVESKK